jgi:hypothetical protein
LKNKPEFDLNKKLSAEVVDGLRERYIMLLERTVANLESKLSEHTDKKT